MSERVTYTIQARRTGFVAIVYVDQAYKVAQQTCHTEQEAQAWADAKMAEVKQEIRQ